MHSTLQRSRHTHQAPRNGRNTITSPRHVVHNDNRFSLHRESPYPFWGFWRRDRRTKSLSQPSILLVPLLLRAMFPHSCFDGHSQSCYPKSLCLVGCGRALAELCPEGGETIPKVRIKEAQANLTCLGKFLLHNRVHGFVPKIGLAFRSTSQIHVRRLMTSHRNLA